MTPTALRALQTGAALVVLAALPYPFFQLDRYTFVKESVLLAAALAGVLLCIGSARKLTVFMVDALVAGFLGLSLVSALLAANGWLAARALGVSLAGAGLFWAARTVARAGHRPRLLAALAAAIVVGAVTGLIQAYGLITTDLASLTRAPGGTFGNRNFMAHLVTIGLPVLLLVTVEARRRQDFVLGAAGVALAAAALVLSRSRAAWLGAAACGVFLAVEGLWVGRLWADQRLRRRVISLAGLAVGGLLLALALPNRLNWRSDSPYLDSLAGVANYKEGSGRGRLIQYGNTLEMAMDHPVLGVGPGNWPVHYPKYMSPGDPSFDADDVIPTNPWPSSDWMAMLAERGLPASLLLLSIGGSIALGALVRVRSGPRRTPALGDLTIVATVIAVVVVGAFDAVLLLPTPTFFAWTVIGALASSARPIREVALSPLGRRRLTVAVAAVGGVLLIHSFSQVAALAISDGGSREALELAAKVDPGSYRIHMRLAQQWRAAGRCDRAQPHAQRARELFPNHPAPQVVLRACGGKRQQR
ncbi:MAG TPA: O-antigen ligase family protein [Gemmatimonadales bacterium]|nr:O-antigen ligase family protein [Gemmatimonadales bacterium]